jgi:hypothetical protein
VINTLLEVLRDVFFHFAEVITVRVAIDGRALMSQSAISTPLIALFSTPQLRQ